MATCLRPHKDERRPWCIPALLLSAVLATAAEDSGQAKRVTLTPSANDSVPSDELVALYATYDRPIAVSRVATADALQLHDDDNGTSLALGHEAWTVNGPDSGVLVIPLDHAFAPGVTWRVEMHDGFLRSNNVDQKGFSDAFTWRFATLGAANGSFRPEAIGSFAVNQQGIAVLPATALRFVNISDPERTQDVVYRLRATPRRGALYAPDGMPLAVGDSFTQHQIDEGAIRYHHAEPRDSSPDHIAFSIERGNASVTPLLWLRVTIGLEGAPVLQATRQSLVFQERQPVADEDQIERAIAPAAGFTRIEDQQVDFRDGSLRLRFSAPWPDDRLEVAPDANILWDDDGVTLRWRSTEGPVLGMIDAVNDGLGGRDLLIHLGPGAQPDNAATTSEALRHLLARIRFVNQSRSLSDGTRNLAITLDDGVEGASTITRTIVVDATNGPPEGLQLQHTGTRDGAVAMNTVFAGHLRCCDPEGGMLTIGLDSQKAAPALGEVSFAERHLDQSIAADAYGMIEPETVQAFTYSPYGDSSGDDSIHLMIDDGANVVRETLTISVAHPDVQGRPYLSDDPPMLALADVTSTWVLSLTPPAPNAAILLQGVPPDTLSTPVLADDGSSLHLRWTPEADARTTSARFSVLLHDLTAPWQAASLPFTIVVPGVPTTAQ